MLRMASNVIPQKSNANYDRIFKEFFLNFRTAKQFKLFTKPNLKLDEYFDKL